MSGLGSIPKGNVGIINLFGSLPCEFVQNNGMLPILRCVIVSVSQPLHPGVKLDNYDLVDFPNVPIPPRDSSFTC